MTERKYGSKISSALMAAQKNFPEIEKSTSAHRYKYATLDQILSLIREPLADEGVVILQPSWVLGDGIEVQSTILHHCESGENVVSELVLSGSGGPQDRGSEVTYLRRYTLLSACGIFPVDEDTDGKEAQEFSKKTQDRKSKKAPKVPKEDSKGASGEAVNNGTIESDAGVHVVVGTFARECKTIGDLTEFWTKNKDELNKLHISHPAMYEKAIAAFSARKAEILSAK